ncbi:YhjD/YihY/BrkB family envelope integrity protein [Auraticoccus monumenti]|uniref:Membrane protein n=1 Tax=Auraticoccus monumenti TaxID=675864 RepID=A0A1G7C0H6_9ACTN|nr:YhjD/YihY/BrkB family envelope integrity protein [Auraticoccus monumenti]SDE32779.1 membrane protein [Auraticoccus monumenti]
MGEWLKKMQHVPWLAHLLRAGVRFTSRLGNAFAGAITYFSVLSLVPIALVTFSVVSLLFDDQVQQLVDVVVAQLGPDLGTQVGEALDQARARAGVAGLVGLLVGAYSGAAWMAQLKSAVRAQWRPSLDDPEEKSNIVVEVLRNLLTLVALLVLIVVTFALSSVATSLTDVVIGWLGLASVPGIGVLLRLVPVVASLVVGFLLFTFLFKVLPQEEVATRAVVKGALAGSIGLAVLQYSSSAVFGLFGGNAAVAAFGPVIVLMLFFNLFARLILFIAAWIATSEQRAIAGEHIEADVPLEQDPHVELEPVRTPVPAEPDRGRNPYSAQVAWSRREGVRIGPEVLEVQYPDEKVQVSQTVATRATRIASVVGWGFGAASGVGLGAAVAALLGRRRR